MEKKSTCQLFLRPTAAGPCLPAIHPDPPIPFHVTRLVTCWLSSRVFDDRLLRPLALRTGPDGSEIDLDTRAKFRAVLVIRTLSRPVVAARQASQ